MFAYRNVKLCTKDCMCLFVCPTGAADTENSVIDTEKCIPGCTACVSACPSGAISIIPGYYPPQQPKAPQVVAALRTLAHSKVQQEKTAENIAGTSNSAVTKQFADALAKSNRLMAESILAESGYMLPQSPEVRGLLEEMVEGALSDFPRDAAELLLKAKA